MSQVPIDPDAFNRFEARRWAKIADPYHRFFTPITSRVIESLLDAAQVGPKARVLDVGAGPGFVAARAAARAASVIGVDIAHEMVTLAKNLHPCLDFRHADAQQLPFKDGEFDAVAGNFILLHLGLPERAVAEFARVLAPGGRLALTVWDVPERARLFSVILDAIQAAGANPPADLPPGPQFFRFSADHEFSVLLRSAGLVEIQVRTLSFTHRFAGPQEIWTGMVTATARTSALILGQPQETQRRIRTAYDRLVREFEVHGGVEVPMAVKLASGRKAEPSQ